jgi:hypothetical protein
VSGRRGLIKGSRPGARRIALFAAIIGGVGSFAIFMAMALGNTDDAYKYGRVSLPGTGVVDLPEGRVALYYEERVTLNENESLDVPDGLRVTARREVTVRSEKAIPNAVNLDGRSLREFAKLEIPQAGRYRVTARAKQSGSNRPAVTFGEGQLENFGRAGILSGGVLGLGLLVALVALLLGRRGYEGERSSFPLPPSGGDGPGWYGSPPPARPPAPPVPGAVHAPSAPAGPSPAPPAPAPPVPAGTDPVEVQLRELERQHQAGALSDADYAARRKQVLDQAFG